MRSTCLLLSAAALLAAVPSAAQPCPGERGDRPRPAESARAAAQRQFTDSLRAGVIEGLRQAGHAEPRGLVVVDVRNRRTGQAEVHAVATTPEVEAAVRSLLAARAAQVAAWPGRESAFHLRLDPGPAARADAVECGPELRNRDAVTREVGRVLAGLAGGDPGLFTRGAPRLTVSARMLVDRRGEVVYAVLTRRSHRNAVDETILDLARRQRFVPATLDGAPVDVWVELPFELRSP